MSVKRRDLIRLLEENGFRLLREGGNHSIYTNDVKVVPVKRHRQFDRITANEICKQAGLPRVQVMFFVRRFEGSFSLTARTPQAQNALKYSGRPSSLS